MKLPRKCRNHEVQPSRGTQRKEKSGTNKETTNATYEITGTQAKNNCNRGTALERSVILRRHVIVSTDSVWKHTCIDDFSLFQLRCRNVDNQAYLNFTTLWANSADYKWVRFSYFPRKQEFTVHAKCLQ